MSTRTERHRSWAAASLVAMEPIAYPALAGAAFCLLSLGVVTWLPALAAVAYALRRWRVEGDSRCFTGVLAAFPRYWRALWRHALASTAGLVALCAAIVFLAGRPEPLAIPLLAVQLGALAAFGPYHLALAVVAGCADASPTRLWPRAALVLAFGAPGRCLALLAAVLLCPILTLPLAVGPFLLGTSLPVLCGLIIRERTEAGCR